MTDYALHWTSAEVNAGNKDPDKDVINPEDIIKQIKKISHKAKMIKGEQ